MKIMTSELSYDEQVCDLMGRIEIRVEGIFPRISRELIK